ncbi:hypothetical protein ACIQU4_27000 [Streptomyces sp. NPDC090741]|uniref:hypothetical protein n=1 Tax=Streptomyces sp. NPDC090741 TaxID=3365967 RepID=UPI0038079EB5
MTMVRPDLVAEVSADWAVDRGGVFRHPLRFKRLRLVKVEDVVACSERGRPQRLPVED